MQAHDMSAQAVQQQGANCRKIGTHATHCNTVFRVTEDDCMFSVAASSTSADLLTISPQQQILNCREKMAGKAHAGQTQAHAVSAEGISEGV